MWELAVGLGLFGLGLGSLRLLGVRPVPTVLAGSAGVAVVLFLGGWMNLAGMLRPLAFFVLIGVGLLCLAGEMVFRWRSGSPRPLFTNSMTSFSFATVAGLLVIGVLMVGGLRQVIWNNDDVSGYLPLAIKALHGHSLSYDPFSDRRITSGVGGATYLGALMYATQDWHALPFLDSVFGLLLYAWGVWSLGAMWGVPRKRLGWALLAIPLATLMKINLTPVYLVAAGLLAMFFVFDSGEDDDRLTWKQVVMLGGLMGASATLKSTNLIFLLFFAGFTAFVHKTMRPHARVLAPVWVSYGLAALLMLPWCLSQHRTEGTYLYPVLGQGFYATAYGRLPQVHTARFAEMALVAAAPMTLLLLACLLVAWKRTESWPARRRAPLLGYLAAASLAVPVTSVGLAADSVDRYAAPFAMPAFLLLLLLVLLPKGGAAESAEARTWQRRAEWLAVLAGVYCVGFVGLFLEWYGSEWSMAEQAFGVAKHKDWYFEQTLAPMETARVEEDARNAQAALPPGSTALLCVPDAFPFDFARNTLYLADVPGMAGLPPGMPIDQGPDALLAYLRSQGVEYVIYSHALDDPSARREEYAHQLMPLYGFAGLVLHARYTHRVQPLGVVQRFTAERVSEDLRQLAARGRTIFEGGATVVISLR